MSSTVTYLDPARVSQVRESDPPPNRSATGYGSKIPIGYELLIDRRWYRVYVVQYSNAGSAYVKVGGKRLFLGSFDPRDHAVQQYGPAKPYRYRARRR